MRAQDGLALSEVPAEGWEAVSVNPGEAISTATGPDHREAAPPGGGGARQ